MIVRNDDHGSASPLTIADYNREAGTITLVVQEVGKSTMQMGRLKASDRLRPSPGRWATRPRSKTMGTVICVGGVGIAPVFPIARALIVKPATPLFPSSAHATAACSSWEERMRSVSDGLVVCTDDGSYGRKALVTEPLKELLEARPGGINRIWAIGPAIMMKFVALTTGRTMCRPSSASTRS